MTDINHTASGSKEGLLIAFQKVGQCGKVINTYILDIESLSIYR